MFITTVPPTAIDDRIAAESNAPEFADCASKLARCGMALRTLGDIATAPINNSIRNVAEEYQQNGGSVPLFRPVDMKGAWLDPESALRVSSQFESKHKKARVVPGNIVIAAAGTVARAARVPRGIEYGAINGSCARVVVPSDADGYVLSYLLSRYGFLSLMRWAVGSVQKHLNLEDIPRASVPWPNRFVLEYIGDKVCQAEQFYCIARGLSRYALRVVDAFMQSKDRASELQRIVRGMRDWQPIADSCLLATDTFVTSHAQTPNHRISRVPVAHLTSRLDYNFYAPEAISIDERLRDGYQTASLNEIIDKSRQITNGVRGPDLQPSPFKLVRLQDREGWSIDFDRCLSISDEQFQENRRCQLREHDVVVAIGGYIGHAAIVRRAQPAVIGQHSAVLPMGENSGVDEGFLVAYLSSHNGAVHLQRYVSGTVQAGINLEDLRDVRIPVPTPEMQRHIGDAVRRADDLSFWSTRLCIAASRFVEALVEGKVVEGDLIDAHNAGRRGDRSLDIGLLSRLTKGGIDVTEQPPLIPDIDALYTAIEGSRCIESNPGDAT